MGVKEKKEYMSCDEVRRQIEAVASLAQECIATAVMAQVAAGRGIWEEARASLLLVERLGAEISHKARAVVGAMGWGGEGEAG